MSKVLTDQIEKRTGGTAIDLPSTGKWPAASIADDAITADKILADSITTAKILDNNVTLAKLSDGTQGGTIYYGASGAPTELAAGTSGQFLQTTGASANPVWASAAAGLASIQVFTSSGNWTRPTGITKVIVEVQGGGAGGARDSSGTDQIGGSAGGYAKKLLDVSSISTSTITIGAAGAGATGSNDAGDDGGDSSWVDGTNTISGLKGVGGNTTNTRTIGGLGTGGDLNIPGGDGGKQIDGRAGSSQFGHGGQNWSVVSGQNNATGYGAGGGAMEFSGGNGGAGTAGIIVVTEYK